MKVETRLVKAFNSWKRWKGSKRKKDMLAVKYVKLLHLADSLA